jgi:hypothetical protein
MTVKTNLRLASIRCSAHRAARTLAQPSLRNRSNALQRFARGLGARGLGARGLRPRALGARALGTRSD